MDPITLALAKKYTEESLLGAGALKGLDGTTPHIGANGNWWIGNVDTGVKASGGGGGSGVEEVYVGTEAPTDPNVKVWINPDGVATFPMPTADDAGKVLMAAGVNQFRLEEVSVVQGPQGEKGDPGAAGQDGTSATHSWNGTTLTITSASGTSSADLKGEKGEKGEKGDKGDKGDTGATGPEGPAGADGKTPVKGTDYYTAADKTEMVNLVLAALPTWTGGSF